MQKNDKFYTFLLSHSSKTNIKIRRFEVSKNLVQTGAIALFFIAGISTLGVGVNGILRNSVLAKSIDKASIVTQMAVTQPIQQSSIDYSRPGTADNITVNSGGPVDNEDSDSEDSETIKRLQVIQNTSDPSYVPTMWAHLGKINNEFGFRRNPFGGRTYEFHPGMDIDGERGDLIVAPANGTVIKAGWTGGYGQMVEIDHGNGLTTRYGHMSKIEVEAGDTITRGQLVGFIGSTGRSTGPHLHYELRLDDRPINPRHFLPPEPTDIAKLN